MKVKILFVMVILILGNIALAKKSEDSPKVFKKSQYNVFYDTPQKSLNLTTPAIISFDDTNNSIVVQVMINGKGPYRFLVDTGLGFSTMTTELERELNLPKVMEGGFYINNVVHQVKFYRVKELSIGEAKLNNYDFIVSPKLTVIDDVKKVRNISFDGILGFGAFKHYLLAIDYPQKKLSLESGTLTNDPSALKYKNDYNVPVLSIKFLDKDKKTLDALFMIDSGFNEEFFLPPNINAIDLKPLKTTEGKGLGTEGESTVGIVQIDGYALIGNEIINNPKLAYRTTKMKGASPIGLMGHAIISKFKITFDQKNALIKFEKIK
ncbi:MAG: retropepsin-like domain-containing protein [Proteobacteria bacterium]|nr:retropepsin-like domain-containing protein [Pseudomonadota bacterium]